MSVIVLMAKIAQQTTAVTGPKVPFSSIRAFEPTANGSPYQVIYCPKLVFKAHLGYLLKRLHGRRTFQMIIDY